MAFKWLKTALIDLIHNIKSDYKHSLQIIHVWCGFACILFKYSYSQILKSLTNLSVLLGKNCEVGCLSIHRRNRINIKTNNTG